MKIILCLLYAILNFVACTSEQTPVFKSNKVLDLNAVASSLRQTEDKIAYSSWDTTIKIFSLETQSVIFNKKIEDICYAKPVLKESKIYFPFSNNKFVCVDLADGKILWEIDLKGRSSNFDFIDDSTILASVKNYGLVAFKAGTGEKRYELLYNYTESLLPDVSPWPVSFDDKNIYVSNWQKGTLSSFKKADGTLNWSFKSNKFSYAGSSIVFNDKIFLGANEFYKGGKIFVLNSLNGTILFEQESKYEEREIPILHNQSIYFYTYDSYLKRFNWNNFEVTQVKNFEKESDLSGHQMFLANENLYYTDASFNLNCYSLIEKKFIRIGDFGKVLIGAFEYKGEVYFV